MMNKKWPFGGRGKPQRNGSKRCLIESNNNDIQDGYDQAYTGYNNPSAQNRYNTHKEQTEEEITQELAELLGLLPDANTSEDGSCCSMRPEFKSQNLIQRSVAQHFPKPPADLDQNLQEHLSNVQETVHKELVKLDPLLTARGLMGDLIDCYHRQTFDHLDDLLQNISSSQNSFVLMNWVLHTYLSQELLGHPELQETDPIKNADLLLLTEWTRKAKDKLLQSVQKEVRGFLEKILQIERSQESCDHEEACMRLYVDIIQCIEAMPKEAQKISSKLSDLVREVCFQELLRFLQRYAAEQTEVLGKKAKMDKPETIHFFKTLKTCKELKQYIQTKGNDITRSLHQQTVETLVNMEAFTLKLLKEIVADIAESCLKSYFKRGNKQFSLINTVKEHFPKLRWCQDIQKRVMDEAYELIVHIYLKHLVRSSQSSLRKRWSADVGQTVAEDADILQYAISDLAPDVQKWNHMLLKTTELLECRDTEAVKVVVAGMQKESLTWSVDLELLPALLQWKGLSGWQVREVLDALPGDQPRPRPVSWYSCLPCC
ncbi:exocyst complex component 3 [Enoplosus armatus]|uniref:exocyst complex component 3 n=1 Tax=Enoplosus armatus TaxID=215367 RepID=UPI0039914E57